MMVCTECSYTFCIGEKGDREHPRGHAAWHAARDQHWVALWCDEPSKGYCFECRRILILGQSKVDKDDYELVPRNKKDEWAGMVASNLKGDSAMSARNGKFDWETVDSSNAMDLWRTVGSSAMDPWRTVGSNAMDPWGMMGSNAVDGWGMVAGDDFVIKGMPNPSGTSCYMNASLQCLLAFGKLRTMFLRPDARLGDIGLHLKRLFVETSIANSATRMLDPDMILASMCSLYPCLFEPGVMADSHEFLTSLCDALSNEVEQPNNLHIMQGDALYPTFSDSTFSCKRLVTISCKSCSYTEVTEESFHGIQLPVPSKDPPARSMTLQLDSTEVKDTVHGRLQTQKNDIQRGTVEVPKALHFIPELFDEESTADSHNPEEKEKAQSSDAVHDVSEHMNSILSIEDCLKHFSHQLTDCKNCSKVAAELAETYGTKNVEQIMASANVNTAVDGDQAELSGRKTCPSERSSDFSSLSAESPSRQPYRSDSHQVILSEEVNSGKSCGEKDLTCCSTVNEKAESHEGVQEAAPSCLTTDEQTDLLSAKQQDTNTKKQGSGKQAMYNHSAQQVEEKQNKQTDGNGGAIQTRLISKLPPVLTIQLERQAHNLSKLTEHVSFKEILHVGPFMDPSSEDKDNLSYRLVGVIEHIGGVVNIGHFIAYVRASQGSGPSSWVCANDSKIRRVSLEEVLRCEAYILFYERIDD
uniref:Uncharacterized protein n=1 Tax=Avena sativa TaxID=4498 RepID=A0ACD6ALZ8_AVESA